jgi:hypothetical protein
LRNQVDVESEQGGLEAHARGGHGGLAAGMSGANDYNVELFGELDQVSGIPTGSILEDSNKQLAIGQHASGIIHGTCNPDVLVWAAGQRPAHFSRPQSEASLRRAGEDPFDKLRAGSAPTWPEVRIAAVAG